MLANSIIAHKSIETLDPFFHRLGTKSRSRALHFVLYHPCDFCRKNLNQHGPAAWVLFFFWVGKALYGHQIPLCVGSKFFPFSHLLLLLVVAYSRASSVAFDHKLCLNTYLTYLFETFTPSMFLHSLLPSLSF